MNWKTLIIKSVLLSAAVILTIAGFYIYMPESEYASLAMIIDKQQHLKNAESPKLIIVGGSGSLFGIDSELIDNEIDGYEVVNAALHGYMELRYLLETVKPFIGPGDIVVVAPEFGLLFDNRQYPYALSNALAEYPAGFRYMNPLRDPFSISSFLLAIQYRVLVFLNLRQEQVNKVHNRKGYNKYGDLVSHLKYDPARFSVAGKDTIEYKPVLSDRARLLNEFDEYVESRNAKAYMTFSPFPRSLKKGDKTGKQWVEELRSQLSIEIISDPDDYLYPDSYFYDTEYHVNSEGRRVRMEKFIKDLKHALNRS